MPHDVRQCTSLQELFFGEIMSLLSSFVQTTFTCLFSFSVAARRAESKAKLEVFRKKRALFKVPLHQVPAVAYQRLRGKTCVIDAVVNSLRAAAIADHLRDFGS